MIAETSALKQVSWSFAAASAAVGFSIEDAPSLFMIFVGLLGGTAAGWPRDRVARRITGLSWADWLTDRLLLWLATVIICLAAEAVTGTHPRVTGLIAAALAFGGPQAMNKLYARAELEVDSGTSIHRQLLELVKSIGGKSPPAETPAPPEKDKPDGQ